MQLVAGAILCGRELISCGYCAHRAQQYKSAVSLTTMADAWKQILCTEPFVLLGIVQCACCTPLVFAQPQALLNVSDQLSL